MGVAQMSMERKSFFGRLGAAFIDLVTEEAPAPRRSALRATAVAAPAVTPKPSAELTSMLALPRSDLELLRQIAQMGGRLVPSLDARQHLGFNRIHGLDELSATRLESVLARLADAALLETQFVDRMPTCPHCASRHVALREVCMDCQSANLASEPIWHHFRCGFVGRASAFGTVNPDRPDEPPQAICPKCRGRLANLGTDHDSPSTAILCRGCGLIMEDPPVEALCLGCGAHSPAEKLTHRDIVCYVLPAHIARALATVPTDASPRSSGLPATIDNAARLPPPAEFDRLLELERGAAGPLPAISLTIDHSKLDLMPALIGMIRSQTGDAALIGQMADDLLMVVLRRRDLATAGQILTHLRNTDPAGAIQNAELVDLAKVGDGGRRPRAPNVVSV